MDTRDPDPVSAVPPRWTWTYTTRTAVRRFSRDQCMDVAAGLTYYAVLASAPAALVLVSILGLVEGGENAADQVLDVVGEIVPKDAVQVLEPLVQQVSVDDAKAGVAFVVGLVVAVWSASGYVGAFSRAMNRVYRTNEGRPLWILRPVLLGVTLLTVILAAAVAAILVLSGPVAHAIGTAIGLGPATLTVWGIVKWPIALILVVIVVAVLYYATPNVRFTHLRWVSVGALVAILVWIVGSVGFGFYVSHFGTYGTTYGTLGAVIVLLLWLWITNLALLFGAELDAELERSRQLREGIHAEETMQLVPRDTRTWGKQDRARRREIAQGRAIREAARSIETTEPDEGSGPHG